VAERIRFHLDEHMPSAVARALRRRGVDVTTAQETGLRTHSDEDHWSFIQRENRVIVTRDKDFLRIAGTGASHPGIAFYRIGRVSIGDMIQGLLGIHDSYSAGEVRDRILFL
jgi:predicted nuclease of predicted toxin-antitoxin system